MMISLDTDQFNAVNTTIHSTHLDGCPVLRVIKGAKFMEFDENTYARYTGRPFHNGIIRVNMFSRLLPDAPDFARGFIGIAYRISDDNSSFESFYIRPTNGRSCPDPVRRSHGCQYFSYPGYTFSYFRDHHITDYEAPADIDLNEWIPVKAVIQDERADFYLNDQTQPVLTVKNMKHGKDPKGAVGLFTDIGTEAFFKDLEIEYFD